MCTEKTGLHLTLANVVVGIVNRTLSSGYPSGMEKRGFSMIPLPEELVERIIGMVPFPYILKARTLSKAWLARLSHSSNGDDDANSHLAISFQKQMDEYWSRKWTSFSPVFKGTEDLIAFDRVSNSWRRIPSLSFLPVNHLIKSGISHQEIEGSLLFIITFPICLSVVNILTRELKQLPLRPKLNGWSCGQETLVCHKETFKVLDFYNNAGGLCLALIFDSKLDAWRRKRVEVPGNFHILSCRVNFNGVVYWLVGSSRKSPSLLAFNLEDETFTVLQMPRSDIPTESDFLHLMVCNSRMLMVVCEDSDVAKFVTLVKVDLESQRWVGVTRCPRLFLGFIKYPRRPASDGDSIFFAGQDGHNDKVLAYNVQKDVWSSFHIPAIVSQSYHSTSHYEWDSSSFQPGLTAFLHVEKDQHQSKVFR